MTAVAEEVVQPAAAPSSQKAAWIEKARSTIANLQGEKKIQAFFNFVPQVRSLVYKLVKWADSSHVPNSTISSRPVNSSINCIRICEWMI
jgi:hypothetical protein